ncbi:Modification methylase HhaI [Posidoniimonas corsicana]|uniref:DNA (cytosine-5-)-methyltransferase n=1 Tax=Posidoniimonas corsicana TaxID=1938618 RepID=A0A5C5VAT5_9BACT|nr:Modification methylase HhaI [Posidoniimonas corsicana]
MLEFFAGVGLARMGFERAGWEVVLANDMAADKKELYEGHFGPSPHYLLDDIHELAEQPDQVPTAMLAHASFPCTDLSLAGARRGINQGQSSAFWGFMHLLENLGERRPPLLLIENVTGLLTSHSGADFQSLLTAMNGQGYAVDAVVLDAACFVPQSRPRLFVLGVRSPARGSDDIAALQPSALRPKNLIAAMQAAPGVAWTLSAPPDPPERGRVKLDEILDHPQDDSPEWWSRERADYLLNQMSDRHRETADRMIAGKRWSYGTVFRRVRNGKSMAELRTDGIAGCLRTPKGGSGRQILFQAGHGEHKVRLLNANECARLMGADGYRVTTRLNQALFGFGDAVCVDAVAWLAEHWLEPHAAALKAAAT